MGLLITIRGGSAAMPGRMKAYWNKVRLPFSRAAASFRRRIETSFLIQKIASYPLGERFLMDMIFRSGVILYCSLIPNFSYGAVQSSSPPLGTGKENILIS